MNSLPSSFKSEDLLTEYTHHTKRNHTRTVREFAEQELIIPNGPHAGERFRCSRQPYSGLLFDAVDSGKFNNITGTGPTQSGKTLNMLLVFLLYHLFEVGENVIFGVPTMDVANDKWREDIVPLIESSGFAHLLPDKGEGSRGGKLENAVTFKNGATLKFMTGGSGGKRGDKKRAAYTARVLVITETDGFDERGTGSDEADKISQLEGRVLSYGSKDML